MPIPKKAKKLSVLRTAEMGPLTGSLLVSCGPPASSESKPSHAASHTGNLVRRRGVRRDCRKANQGCALCVAASHRPRHLRPICGARIAVLVSRVGSLIEKRAAAPHGLDGAKAQATAPAGRWRASGEACAPRDSGPACP
jgi:hypothetical protein